MDTLLIQIELHLTPLLRHMTKFNCSKKGSHTYVSDFMQKFSHSSQRPLSCPNDFHGERRLNLHTADHFKVRTSIHIT